MSQRLETRGRKVVTVASGEEAVKIVEDHNFDVAVVDLAMPGIDGIETLKQITELGNWSSKEIITAFIVVITILVIALKNFVPALAGLHKTCRLFCFAASMLILWKKYFWQCILELEQYLVPKVFSVCWYKL